MEYYIALAKEQKARLKAFEAMWPDRNRLDNRLAFFSQSYEIHISESIMSGIVAEYPHQPK